MSEAPRFFVPAATPDNQEMVYADFAEWCGRPVPELERRIYSIPYVHDGEEWTATVGQTLEAFAIVSSAREGKRSRGRIMLAIPPLCWQSSLALRTWL